MKCSVLVVVTLCGLISAIPLPASDDLQMVQIPLQGNKVNLCNIVKWNCI